MLDLNTSLTLVKYHIKQDKGGKWYSLYKCICGSEVIKRDCRVLTNQTKSCGCLQKQASRTSNSTHKDSYSKEYRTWRCMKLRCYNKRNASYKNYGERGIIVCERWHKFENFLADMGRKPTIKHSIDRINVNGNYEPGNCRWATSKEQAANKR